MKIFGLDFTSAPRPSKPITCAECRLEPTRRISEPDHRVCDASHRTPYDRTSPQFSDRYLHKDILQVEAIHSMVSFAGFEALIDRPGPWVAGMDFPFGQPRRLVENLAWPQTWEGYVSLVGDISKAAFISLLEEYRRGRPHGDKQHLRRTDRLAGSRSPMMVVRVPVGRMFFEGAPRLCRTRLNVLPCRPTTDDRTVLEAYPALVARRWASRSSYKAERPDPQEDTRRAVRRVILEGLSSTLAEEIYKVRVIMSQSLFEECLVDNTGDSLDAVLCALQAAWASQERERGFGIPEDCDPLEGWIVDPSLRG